MTDALGRKPAPGPDQPPIPVRLVTFNIHHGVGEDGRHDLPRLAKVLAESDADVICLQEVDRHWGPRSEDVDQPLLLSRALDMQLAWGPAIDEPGPEGGPRRQYGVALLSRLPILVSDVHRLPGRGEPRVALRTLLELDGGTLWVTTTHLSTRTDSSFEQRAAQTAAVAALHTGPMESGAVAGDVNVPPDAPELDGLRDRFADAWELAQEREDQAGWRVWQRDEGYSFPARSPHQRIDQVWITPDVAVAAARVLDSGGTSDHLPVLVDLEVPSGV